MNDFINKFMPDNDKIRQIFLSNGYNEKEQGDGTYDLHPYVYKAAKALVHEVLTCVDQDIEDKPTLDAFYQICKQQRFDTDVWLRTQHMAFGDWGLVNKQTGSLIILFRGDICAVNETYNNGLSVIAILDTWHMDEYEALQANGIMSLEVAQIYDVFTLVLNTLNIS